MGQSYSSRCDNPSKKRGANARRFFYTRKRPAPLNGKPSRRPFAKNGTIIERNHPILENMGSVFRDMTIRKAKEKITPGKPRHHKERQTAVTPGDNDKADGNGYTHKKARAVRKRRYALQ